MRFARYSKDLTKAAKFKDRRSKIGVRFDGTLRFDLAGRDKMELREKVFERDNWHCVDDITRISECAGQLEFSHWPPMSKSGGSDEMAKTFCRCRRHHRLLDGHGCDLHF